ncbi:MAG: hypothetical protein GTO24_27585 [candidate division Zixibacteria bacterium]|nr:hypothetical protein [candidate division Zixibacteria bacterium]
MKDLESSVKIIGALIAFLVLVMMVCDHLAFKTSIKKMAEQNTIARESVERMAEQNKLSEAAISRMDSSITLMHESNRLQSQAIALEMARNEVVRSEIIEKTRPKIYIRPLTLTDISKDSVGTQVWTTIENKGLSDADSLTIRTYVRYNTEASIGSTTYTLDRLQASDGRVFPTIVRHDSASFSILVKVWYGWSFAGPADRSFCQKNAYRALFDEDTRAYKRVRTLDQIDIRKTFADLATE